MKARTAIFKSVLFAVCVFFFTTLKNVYADNSLYELQGGKVTYTDNNSLIIAEGDASAKDQFGKEIFSEKIIYNKKNSTIKTIEKSIFIDGKGNRLFADSFLYDLNLKTIDVEKNVEYLDKEGNVFNFSSLKYQEDIEKGVGVNLKAQLIDKSSVEGFRGEFDNKLGTLIIKENESGLFKNIFNIFKSNQNTYTPCEDKENSSKTIVERCPDWSLTTTKTTHNKNEKMVYHENAVVKIKNIPVFYTPYFSHPDPSVKRKSGFLPPTIKNFTDLGRTVKTPYFWAIDDNKDLTFTPIYYFDENPIFLAEYLQLNKNSKFYIDTSYTQGYNNINKKDKQGVSLQRTGGSRNHLFFNFLGKYENLLLGENDLEINVQRISQKNYLNVNQINTDHVKQDTASLNNGITINSYEGSRKINIEAHIYENLNIDNKNEKYQYTLPSIQFNNYFNKFNQSVNTNLLFSAKNLGGDSNQINQRNEFSTASDLITSKSTGIGSTLRSTFSNINMQNSNIESNKENFNSDTFATFGIEAGYPLMKVDGKFEQTISPKVLTKFSTGSTAYADSALTSYSDIFSMRQNPFNSSSFGYGIEYEGNNKNINNEVFFNSKVSMGQLLNEKKLNSSTTLNSISEKSSDFIGGAEMFYSQKIKESKEIKVDDETQNTLGIKNGLNINYNYILSNSLNKILKNQLDATYSRNGNSFSSSYYETHDYIGNDHYIDLKYEKNFDNDVNVLLGTKKNIQDSFTENNSIELNYDSDCLKIGLSLVKTFYQNQDLKPSNNLIMSIVLKPFGTPIAPDLSSFLN